MSDDNSPDGGAPDGGSPDAGAPPGGNADGGAPPGGSTDAGTQQPEGSDGGATPDAAMPVDAARGDNTNTAAPDATVPVVLTVQCAHSGRQVVANQSDTTFMIVPNSSQTILQTGLTIQTFVQLQVQASSGGSDTITAQLANSDGTCSAQPQIAITQAASPSDSDWQNGPSASLAVQSPGDSSTVWLDGATPTVYNVFGRGDPDGTPVQVQVQAFPAYGIQGTVNLNFFNDFANAFNSFVKTTIQPLTGGTVDISPQILMPAGNLQVSCGWKENSDYQAYYGWAVTAGLEPLFGMSLSIQPNLAALVGTAVGIPPQLTSYAANIFLTLQVGGQVGLSGTMSQAGPNSVAGGIQPDGQLWILFGLGAKVGNDQLVSAQITGTCKTGVTFKAALVYQSGPGGGLVLNPSISWDGIVLTVRIVTAIGGEEATNNELCSWSPIPPSNPWQPDKPWVLIGN